MTQSTHTAGLGDAPDEREAPAEDATQLRLRVAEQALAHLFDMSCAVDKTLRAARQLEHAGETDEARGLVECAAVVQSLMGYIAARAGNAVRDVKPTDATFIEDTASWLMPSDLDRTLALVERGVAQ